MRWAVREAERTVAIRLVIGPSPRRLDLTHLPELGRGTVLRDGGDAVLLSYGPVMLNEALVAAENLAERRARCARHRDALAQPARRRLARGRGCDVRAPLRPRGPRAGRRPGDGLRAALSGRLVTVFGVEGWPACGAPDEALRFHGLDGASLAARIAAAAGRGAERAASSAAR